MSISRWRPKDNKYTWREWWEIWKVIFSQAYTQRGGRKMKTGDLVIFSGLVNPDLNIGLVEEEDTHKMLIWD